MAQQYYYSRGADEFGPFSADQLRELAATGRIEPTDAVWRQGSERRCLASRVEHLFPPRPPADIAPEATPEPEAETTPADTESVQAAEEPADAEVAAPEPPAKSAFFGNHPAEKPRPKRVTAIKGAILVGQDGYTVKFLKKCEKCQYEDRNRSTSVIRAGSTRVPFFCPKCRRGRQVVITGVG